MCFTPEVSAFSRVLKWLSAIAISGFADPDFFTATVMIDKMLLPG